MQGIKSMLNELTVEEFLTLTNYSDYTESIQAHAGIEYFVENGEIKGIIK